MMCDQMMLVAYDPNKPHKVISSASNEGIRFALLQLHKEEDCTCNNKV